MAYYKNRENQFSLTIGGKTHVLAAGVYSWSESASYNTDETEYYDNTDDATEMEVLSISRDFTFQVHEPQKDSGACSAIWGLRGATGEDAHVTLAWTDPMGSTETWDCTVHDVTADGGDAGAKFGFQFQLHFNRKTTVSGS